MIETTLYIHVCFTQTCKNVLEVGRPCLWIPEGYWRQDFCLVYETSSHINSKHNLATWRMIHLSSCFISVYKNMKSSTSNFFTKIAKLRWAYPCGNVKSNCNFVFHNGERQEITWEWKHAQVIFKDVQMVQTLERKERTGRENRQTTICVHNNITFRVWHVISFLSPLWKTKLQLDFTLPQG